MSESQYAATMDMEEAPYIPTHGEYKLDSGYSIRQYVPLKLGTQDTDEESNKYWVLPYDDYSGFSGTVGISMENRYKTGYIDYDVYSIAEGIGGYAPDIKLAIHGGPIPMLNWCAAATTMRQKVAPHPSGFTDWSEGKTILGYVMEEAVPTGEQCLIYLDIERTNKIITELLSTPDVAGDDPIFNATYTPLKTITVASIDGVVSGIFYEGDPTSTTQTYSFAGTGYTVRDEDSVTGLAVTYEYLVA